MVGAQPVDVGNFTVPEFTAVLISMHYMNNKEGLAWKNAAEWRPERWLEEGTNFYPPPL